MVGVLNLQKNDILDLTKAEPGLQHVMLGAGWDVAKKGLFGFGQDKKPRLLFYHFLMPA